MLGAEDVAYIDGELYIGADGGGAGHGNEDLPSGVYRATGDGGAELVADLSTWVRENPVAAIPPDSDPDAAGYSLVVDPTSGTLWVDDPNSGQVLSVATDGTITRVADLSAGHLVPTRLALDPEGGVYYGILTTVPFADGAAGVFHLAEDGTAESVWSGLTTVVDVAVGPDGALYALELSTGNLAEPPFLTPGSGRVVRQTGPDTSEVVLEGLMFAGRHGDRPRRNDVRVSAGNRRQRRQRSDRELRPERAACRRDDARGRRRLRADRRDAVTGDRRIDTAGCLGRSGRGADRLGGSRHGAGCLGGARHRADGFGARHGADGLVLAGLIRSA